MFAAAIGVAVAKSSGNMNGEYKVWSGKPNAPFNSDYGSKGHEYFDIWAPEMATHYGEVFWTDQGNVPLPPHIVERFKGKVMAITGYEQDQVMVTPTGKPGVNPDKDVSVPINWAYNHHYMAWMTGEHSYMKKELAQPGDYGYGSGWHGERTKLVPVERESAKNRNFEGVAPTSQMFSEGNGGESRKSFHGYPNGFAQLIESPTSWHITPMQIDTRNRAHGVGPESVHNCTNMTLCAGPEPRQARYGRNWGGVTGSPVKAEGYSGILECPCNGGYGGSPQMYGKNTKTKIIDHKFSISDETNCEATTHIESAVDCFTGAAGLGINATKIMNKTTADLSLPQGCSVVVNADGTATASFNTAGNAGCSSTAAKVGQATTTSGVTVALVLDSATKKDGVATITLSGPSDAWFGVGFNAVVMSDQPYTIYANSSGVFEQKLGTCGSEAEHCPGDSLPGSIKVVSNTVNGDTRTVIVTRPLVGLSPKHYTFDPATKATINIITAAGMGQAFSYHKAHASAVISVTNPVGVPSCICDTGKDGMLCGPTGQGCGHFTKNCNDQPGGLLEQNNPTCNSRQYVGGLSCCHHGRIMLDEDQAPGTGDLLRYHMKWRFWFEEYAPAANNTNASHYDLPRYYYQTESNAGEYDIPPAFSVPGNPVLGYDNWPVGKPTPGTTCTGNCPDGPDCECVHEIQYHWTMSNAMMIYAGGHCHAPACISIELYKNDTGTPELLCRQLPIYGQGNIQEDKYDEAGYLALPPCLWGSAEEGLEPPVWLGPKTPMFSIKKNRNTHMGHFGEMASWQMRGVPIKVIDATAR